MSDRRSLTDRLNEILPTITADTFLAAEGVGNEIPYHIFEYPPADELTVRDHIAFLQEKIPQVRPGIRLVSINLFDFLIEHLRDRKLLDRCFEMDRRQGQEQLRKHLDKVLEPSKTAPLLAEQMRPGETDLVLLHGVGSVWPFLRASGLLSSLHQFTGNMPVVMFYPGSYDQVAFRLYLPVFRPGSGFAKCRDARLGNHRSGSTSSFTQTRHLASSGAAAWLRPPESRTGKSCLPLNVVASRSASAVTPIVSRSQPSRWTSLQATRAEAAARSSLVSFSASSASTVATLLQEPQAAEKRTRSNAVVAGVATTMLPVSVCMRWVAAPTTSMLA